MTADKTLASLRAGLHLFQADARSVCYGENYHVANAGRSDYFLVGCIAAKQGVVFHGENCGFIWYFWDVTKALIRALPE